MSFERTIYNVVADDCTHSALNEEDAYSKAESLVEAACEEVVIVREFSYPQYSDIHKVEETYWRETL